MGAPHIRERRIIIGETPTGIVEDQVRLELPCTLLQCTLKLPQVRVCGYAGPQLNVDVDASLGVIIPAAARLDRCVPEGAQTQFHCCPGRGGGALKTAHCAQVTVIVRVQRTSRDAAAATHFVYTPALYTHPESTRLLQVQLTLPTPALFAQDQHGCCRCNPLWIHPGVVHIQDVQVLVLVGELVTLNSIALVGIQVDVHDLTGA